MLTSHKTIFFSLIAALFMTFNAASAQHERNKMMPPKFRGQDQMEAKPRIHEKIEQFKKMKLIEVLDLSEESSEKFFTRYNIYQKKVDEAYHSLQDANRDLDEAVDRKAASAEIQKLTDAMLQKQNSLQDANNEKLKAMKSVLSEEQYAKYVMFEQKFMQELQKAIMQRKKMRNQD